MDSRVFEYRYRVTYRDCTVGNHVYYARYLDILEAARGQCFRDLGITFLGWQGREITFPVLECHITYQRPAAYDDELLIRTTVEGGGARLIFRHQAHDHEGRPVFTAYTEHVCANLAGKPRRLPPELAIWLSMKDQGSQDSKLKKVRLGPSGGSSLNLSLLVPPQGL
jgi:acyl-CoA thioester hydrolase